MHYNRPPQGVAYYPAPAPWSGNTLNSYEYQGYPYLRNNPQYLHHPSYSSGPSPYQSRNHAQQQPYYYVQPPHFPHHGQYMHVPQDPLPMQQMSPSSYQLTHQIQQDQYYPGGQQHFVGNHQNNNDGKSTSRSFQKKIQQQSHEYTRYNQVQGEGLTAVNADENYQKEIEEQCYNEKIQDSNAQRKINLKCENIINVKIDTNHEESVKSKENSKESNKHKEKDNSSNQKETIDDDDDYQDHCGSYCRDNGQIKHKIEEINQSEEVHFSEKLQENINTTPIFKSSPKNNQKVSAPENLKIPLKYLQSEQNPKILQNISKKTVIEKKCKNSNYLNGNSIAGASFKAKYLSQQKTPLLHRRKIRSMKYLLDIQKQQQELQMQQQNEEGHKNPFFLESKIKYPRISVPCRKIPNSINLKVSQVFKGCFKHKYECVIQGGSGQLSSYAKQQNNNLEEECCSLNTPSTLNVANESGNTLAAQREQYNLFLAQQDTIHRNIAFCKIKTKKILKRKQELTQYIENYKAMLEIKAIRQYLLSLSLSDFMWNFLRFLEVQMKTNQKDFNDFKIQLLQLESEPPNIFMNWIIQNEQISSYFVAFLTAPLDKFIKTEDQSQVHQIISSFIQKTVHDISCEPTSPVTIESEENEQIISQELA